MKIVHVVTRLSDKHPGGVERVVTELAKRQSKQHNVEVICRNVFDDVEIEEKDGYTIKRAKCADIDGLRTLSSIYSMRKLIRESKADIYHLHDWSPSINYFISGSPAKSVLTLHNLATTHKSSFFEEKAVKNADKVTCVSKWLSEHIESRYNVNSTTIWNGVEPSKFKNKDSQGYALFIGSLDSRKGIKPLCSALSDLNIDFKVVGDGPLRDISSGGDQEFLGTVSEYHLKELLEKAEFLAVPSRKEGFGLVWIEALAAGKPILYTNTGVGPELPEYGGVCIDTNYTIDDLKKSINEIRSREFNSDKIRSYARENFDWEKISKSYEKLYMEECKNIAKPAISVQ